MMVLAPMALEAYRILHDPLPSIPEATRAKTTAAGGVDVGPFLPGTCW